MTTTATVFIQDSVRMLRDTYVPRLRRALDILPEEELWRRPHEDVIAFGTILLHLEGNVRQWICSGLGADPDHRDRASEFAATTGPDGQALIALLEETVARACEVIAGLDDAALQREYPIQGERVTGLYAVYHVVEHFSWHTGQAVWIAKASAGAQHGLAFFDEAAVNAAKNG